MSIAKSKGARALSRSLYPRLQEALLRLSTNESEYPPTLERLFACAGEPLDDASLEAVAFSASLKRHVCISAKAARGKSPDYFARSLAFLPGDTDKIGASAELLRSVLRLARSAKTNVFLITELVKLVPSFLRPSFGKALRSHVDTGEVPVGVGLVLRQKLPQFFLLEHAVLGRAVQDGNGVRHNGANVQLAEFERDFQNAFERLDVQTGKHNYVLLHDLRRALPDIPRGEFDAHLNDLRRSKRFSLDSDDGRHVRLTPDQLEAGIREANSLLVYVARR
jgi:hypothetical protein